MFMLHVFDKVWFKNYVLAACSDKDFMNQAAVNITHWSKVSELYQSTRLEDVSNWMVLVSLDLIIVIFAGLHHRHVVSVFENAAHACSFFPVII